LDSAICTMFWLWADATASAAARMAARALSGAAEMRGCEVRGCVDAAVSAGARRAAGHVSEAPLGCTLHLLQWISVLVGVTRLL
jgi:hypothetical protein